MKKIFALVIAVVLVISLAVPGFAAEARACAHEFGSENREETFEPYNASQCKKTVRYWRVCRKCGAIRELDPVTTYPNHVKRIARASCDGATQTHEYGCRNCRAYTGSERVKCPGANLSHKNGCQWLPI